MSIEIDHIVKKFGDFTALNDVHFKIETGELIALLGPSGSGKTTLLRIIAGLETADSGKVLFHGDDVSNQKVRERGVGFVFQHYALFRHMTVFENVAFGLKIRPNHARPSSAQIKDKVYELLKLVRLEGLAPRYPSQLSGGQRQRVALARALAIEPKMLLLDEPFGALDAKVRKELRQWLRDLHDKLHMTSVFVTHDQEEALEVADRIVVMNEGRMEQIGTPDEVYHQPVNPFVYNFLGNVNLFRGRVIGGKAQIGKMSFDLSHPSQHDEGSSTVFVRPHELDIHRTPKADNYFEAHVLHIYPAGLLVKVELISEWGDPVQVEISQEKYRQLKLRKNDSVYVSPLEKEIETEVAHELAQAAHGKKEILKGAVIWLTGLSGAGKSTIAYLLKNRLKEKGLNTELLDGEVIRTNVSEGLSFSKEDRDANIRRIGFICHLLARNGVLVIVAATSPYREAREHNRLLIQNYIEVYLKCPVEICESRDTTGLYKKARAGQIKEFTGVNAPYEEPLYPEIVCETDKESSEESVEKILDYLHQNDLVP